MADNALVNTAAPYSSMIAANEAAPTNPLTTASQALQVQAQKATADDAQLANAQNHMAFITQAMTPLLAKGANITSADVASAGADAIATSNGRIQPQEIAQFVSTLPGDGPGIQAALQQHQLRLLGAQQQIATLRGDTTFTQQPNGVTVGNVNSFSGKYAPQGGQSGFIASGTSPSDRIAPDTITNPDGTVVQSTRGQTAAAKGIDPVSGMPFQGAIKRSGGAPVPATGPAMSSTSSGGTTGAGSQTVGGIPGPDPNFAAGQSMRNDDYKTAAETYQSLQPLMKALPLLRQLAATGPGTGPGTQAENAVKSFLIAQHVIAPDANVDIRHEADKYLSQAVANSPLSGRSDMGLLKAQAANPNTITQTTPATIALVQNGISQGLMNSAAPLAHGNQNAATYPKFKGGFTQTQDQRAYGLNMEPDGGVGLVKQMAALPVGDPARSRFFDSMRNARMQGVRAPGQ